MEVQVELDLVLQKTKRVIYRIEGPDGIGPFFGSRHYLPDEVHDKMYAMPLPYQEFDGAMVLEELCRQKLKAPESKCFFGFSSYQVFKKYVGEHEKELRSYTKVYVTDRYLMSHSGEQVIFVRDD